MERIVLVGGGGHCKSVIDTISSTNEYQIVGIVDVKEKIGQTINGVNIIGCDDDLLSIYRKEVTNAFITIGSIGDASRRINSYKQLKKIGFELPIIIDKTSIISNRALIEEGTYIGKGSIVNCNVIVKSCAIINTGAVIEHESIIGSFVHIAPGSVLSGNVIIGDGTHIGTNSTIIQGIRIGQNTLIGAGSVVTKSISNNVKAYGNPCRVIEQ